MRYATCLHLCHVPGDLDLLHCKLLALLLKLHDLLLQIILTEPQGSRHERSPHVHKTCRPSKLDLHSPSTGQKSVRNVEKHTAGNAHNSHPLGWVANEISCINDFVDNWASLNLVVFAFAATVCISKPARLATELTWDGSFVVCILRFLCSLKMSSRPAATNTAAFLGCSCACVCPLGCDWVQLYGLKAQMYTHNQKSSCLEKSS